MLWLVQQCAQAEAGVRRHCIDALDEIIMFEKLSPPTNVSQLADVATADPVLKATPRHQGSGSRHKQVGGHGAESSH